MSQLFEKTGSLWSKTATSAPPMQAFEGGGHCDVVVIGGGFTGLRAAGVLAEAGTSVIVVEASEIGFGASGRSGGEICVGFKHDPHKIEKMFGADLGARIFRTSVDAADELFNLVEKHGLNCDAQRTGWLKASHCGSALRDQETQFKLLQQRGVEVELLDGKQIVDRVGAHGYQGGLYFPQGGTLHPLSYTRELARIAIEKGAVVYEHAPVLRIVRSNGSWRVETSAGTLTSSKVIVATNGYSDGIWPGLMHSIMPIRSVQAATEPLSESLRQTILPGRSALSDTRRILYYCRMTSDDRLCFGTLGPMRDVFKADDFLSIKKGATLIFPSLAEIRWDYHWGGRLAMTYDLVPHMHEPAPGLLIGVGFNGRGVAMCTAVGRLLGEYTLSENRDQLPLPLTRIKHYPFYEFRVPGLKLASAWMTLRDRIDLSFG